MQIPCKQSDQQCIPHGSKPITCASSPPEDDIEPDLPTCSSKCASKKQRQDDGVQGRGNKGKSGRHKPGVKRMSGRYKGPRICRRCLRLDQLVDRLKQEVNSLNAHRVVVESELYKVKFPKQWKKYHSELRS